MRQRQRGGQTPGTPGDVKTDTVTDVGIHSELRLLPIRRARIPIIPVA